MGHRTLFVDHFFLYNKSEEKTCNECLLILLPPFCQQLEKHLKYYVNLSSFLSLSGLGSKTTCVWGKNPAKLHCWCKRSWFWGNQASPTWGSGGEGRILCDRWKGAQAQAQAPQAPMGRRGVEDAENPPRLPQTTVASTSRRLHWWVET